MARIAVIGSRDYPDMDRVREVVGKLAPTNVVITGGWWVENHDYVSPTRGVDRVAAAAAVRAGCTVVLVAADWNKYKKAAGFRRNPTIIDLADIVFIFWDGESRGTKHGIDYVQKIGKDYDLYQPCGETPPDAAGGSSRRGRAPCSFRSEKD